MRPLQSIAMGLVVVAVNAFLGGYDALPDPVGWLLVVLGVRRLPPTVPHRGALLGAATAAGAVSVPLWLPAVDRQLAAADASLSWAASLPQVGCTVLLCHVLAAAARDADPGSARALRLTRDLLVVVGLLPVLVLGAGLDVLAVPTQAAATVGLAVLLWLLFSRSGRPWASEPPLRSVTSDPTRA